MTEVFSADPPVRSIVARFEDLDAAWACARFLESRYAEPFRASQDKPEGPSCCVVFYPGDLDRARGGIGGAPMTPEALRAGLHRTGSVCDTAAGFRAGWEAALGKR